MRSLGARRQIACAACLDDKNEQEARDYLRVLPVEPALAEQFLLLTRMYGGMEVVQRAKCLPAGVPAGVGGAATDLRYPARLWAHRLHLCRSRPFEQHGLLHRHGVPRHGAGRGHHALLWAGGMTAY